MKYSIDNYVEAFTQALKEGTQKDISAGFVKLLQKNGDIKHFKKIIEAIHKKMVNDKDGKWINIETAREVLPAREKTLRHNFSEKDHINFKINPELVAGIRITVNGQEELDNSLNQKLKRLFK